MLFRSLRSAREFMPRHDQFMFSDADFRCTVMFGGPGNGSSYVLPTDAKGFPRETLMRYHTILKEEKYFRNYDQLF